MKKVIYVAGARPNFVKLSNILRESKNNNFSSLLVHTGQHYTQNMSNIFFEELGIDEPDINFDVGSGSHAQQTANIMKAFEPVVLEYKPDIVVVVGDVNSTIACALVSSKLNISVAHIEAGLRSFDKSMPEEINRILTDSVSDYLFVSEESGIKNLKKEGISDDRIYFVGNTMVDSLVYHMKEIDKSKVVEEMGLGEKSYIVFTSHRPSNVDNIKQLNKVVNLIEELSKQDKVIIPIHPRTMNKLKQYKYEHRIRRNKNVILVDPLGYIDFIRLVKSSKMVVTDSGGIQEETTFLGVPCFTIRENTERPITITVGTNYLVDMSAKKIFDIYNQFLEDRDCSIPELWDGNTAKRIIKILLEKA